MKRSIYLLLATCYLLLATPAFAQESFYDEFHRLHWRQSQAPIITDVERQAIWASTRSAEYPCTYFVPSGGTDCDINAVAAAMERERQTAQLTDQTKLLEQVKAEFPAAWACAHTDRACAWDYIKIVACRLNPDGKGPWGLNGRRGDPRPERMSWDALNYCGQGPASDPTGKCAKPLTIIDVIAGAGGPSPSVIWMPFTSDPTAGAWIKPFDCAGVPAPKPLPKPVPQPPAVVKPAYPGDAFGFAIGQALAEDYAEAGQGPNPGMGVWFWRTAWDTAVNGLAPEAALKKHRAEWRKALGLDR